MDGGPLCDFHGRGLLVWDSASLPTGPDVRLVSPPGHARRVLGISRHEQAEPRETFYKAHLWQSQLFGGRRLFCIRLLEALFCPGGRGTRSRSSQHCFWLARQQVVSDVFVTASE